MIQLYLTHDGNVDFLPIRPFGTHFRRISFEIWSLKLQYLEQWIWNYNLQNVEHFV